MPATEPGPNPTTRGPTRVERWAIRVGGGMLAFAIAVEAFLAIRGDPFGIGFGGLVPLISVGAFGTFVLFVLARDRLR